MAEPVVEVVDGLDGHPGQRCLAEGRVGLDPADDGAVALDGSGLSAASLEMIYVGSEQLADGVASGGPVGVEPGRQLGEQSLGVAPIPLSVRLM
ncbi:MAG: hypothetical protein GY698_02555 [Actinomycetia bacterium]|nr:hypothetical protein [Actinomycetes bacterium]